MAANPQAPVATVPRGNGETCVVGCKIPMGFIVKGYRKVEEDEPVLGGGHRTYTKFVETGEQVKLNGCPVHRDPNGQPPQYPIVGGYGLTFNVPLAFMEGWFEHYRDSPLVKNRIIIFAGKQADLEAKAREGDGIATGMQPVDPTNDPRAPKNVAVGQRT